VAGFSRYSRQLSPGPAGRKRRNNHTRYWPHTEFWNNRILLLETSDETPTVDQVVHMLRNYGMQGILGVLAGLVFARPYGYREIERDELEKAIVRVVSGEFGCSNLVIVANVDFGHTDPKLVFPLGTEIELNPVTGSICLIESALA
jgi:muramoyltetrapeptide carboxypeptidase LdcA involved in peptidoglycan recycling